VLGNGGSTVSRRSPGYRCPVEDQQFDNDRKGVESKHRYECEREAPAADRPLLFVFLGFRLVGASGGRTDERNSGHRQQRQNSSKRERRAGAGGSPRFRRARCRELEKEDFQVFDKDKLQIISGFIVEKRARVESERKARGSAQGAASLAAPNVSPHPSPVPERFLVFLFDDIHLGPGDLMQVQKAATMMLAESLAHSDMASQTVLITV
jgi:hypothetical protein